jgi:6-pyruvoyltetrahydropterin/6-carboxytetrahydropterin synthase
LYNPNWTPQENEDFFGKCSNKYYHGHNFELFVTVKGTASLETGMVIDLKQLKKIVKEEIIEKIDHRNLNEDVDFMKGIIPSIENIIVEIWNILEEKLGKGALHYIKLTETENNYVEYYGE